MSARESRKAWKGIATLRERVIMWSLDGAAWLFDSKVRVAVLVGTLYVALLAVLVFVGAILAAMGWQFGVRLLGGDGG